MSVRIYQPKVKSVFALCMSSKNFQQLKNTEFELISDVHRRSVELLLSELKEMIENSDKNIARGSENTYLLISKKTAVDLPVRLFIYY